VGDLLFMDGHIEFINYPGKFPVTERFIKALEAIEKLPENDKKR